MLLNSPPFKTHHVNELSYGQSKLDNDHVGDVRHRSRPLVVTGEQRLEEVVLGVRVRLVIAKSCGNIISNN